jgi:hypothetical protein
MEAGEGKSRERRKDEERKTKRTRGEIRGFLL